MDRTLLLLAVASVGGIVVLAGTAELTDAPLVPIDELALHAGTTVRVEGVLLDVKTYDGGFARALLSSVNRSVPILARDGLPAAPGDRVRVEARVLQENGRLELDLERPDDLVVVRVWRDAHTPLRDLIADPWSHRSANLRTSGVLIEQSNLLWIATDDRASRIGLVGAPRQWVGDNVLVDGLFQYEPATASFRIHVERLEPLDA